MANPLPQLPRGRHRLPREQARSSQRGRMLRAVAEAVAAKGFAWVTVADIISGAGVSRETFYEHFSDKEECLIAMLDEGARVLYEILAAVVDAEADDPIEQLDMVLKAYLNTLAGEPAFAKTFLIDAYGAGPRAIARRIELQRSFIDLVAEIFDATDPDSVGRFACEALVASISSMVTVRVGSGRLDELPALREPIVALVRRVASGGELAARDAATVTAEGMRNA